MAQLRSTQDIDAELIRRAVVGVETAFNEWDDDAVVEELQIKKRRRRIFGSSSGTRPAATAAQRTQGSSSSTDKENNNNNNNGTTATAIKSSSSSLQSQNESSSGESRSSNVGGDRDDMDVDHVDFTGSGGGGDVDMIDESDDTSSTPPDDPSPRRSPRLASANDEASSSTSAQTQLGDTASTAATTSVVTANGKTLPHVRTAVHLPPPHNHESYGNHPQLREHKNCPGRDSCTRGSCILRRMIPQMKPGGDLDYNYGEKRIDVKRHFAELRRLECPSLLEVFKKVDKLPSPSDKSKSTKTTNKKSKTIVRRENTYTHQQMITMTGAIIMKYKSMKPGQDGYDTVLEICDEYVDEWEVCDTPRKEVILQEMYDRTIALGFNWFEAENETNQRNGNLYRLEAVTHFSNGNTKPGKDGVSPRQYLCKKMNRVKDQKEVADAKKKEEKKAKSEMKAMIKMIKKAPSLFRDKRLSDPNFDIRKKISEADIARVEKEIKEVKAMQTVIPPASDFTKDIIHVPTVYILVAFALLIEFFLQMDADKKPCTFKKLCDTIEEHTGLELSNIIHKGMYDSYEARWKEDWKGMLGDIAVYLPLLLAGMSALYRHPLGMTWMDLFDSEHHHLTNLFIKFKGVGELKKNGSSLSIILIEACKCAGIDKSTHERGDERRDHDLKLRYEPVLRYDFGGAEIASADHFFNSKEILKLRFVLEKNGLLDCKGEGRPPEVSWRAVKVMLWLTVGVVVSDIHPKTDEEWQAQLINRRATVNQMLFYLYKSMSKNPNPNGPRFLDIIPIRKSGIQVHHPIEYDYDVGPSQLILKPTDYMISELIEGECIPLLSGDHHAVTGYEKKWWKDIPEWLKKFSRFEHNY